MKYIFEENTPVLKIIIVSIITLIGSIYYIFLRQNKDVEFHKYQKRKYLISKGKIDFQLVKNELNKSGYKGFKITDRSLSFKSKTDSFVVELSNDKELEIKSKPNFKI